MKNRGWLMYVIIVFGMLFATFTFYFYQIFFTPNILIDGNDAYVKIYEEDTFDIVLDRLHKNRIVQEGIPFAFVAKVMNYQENVKPGLYRLKADMTNREAIYLLRSGEQEPINITFNNLRLKSEVPQIFGAQLMCDTVDFHAKLNSDEFTKSLGFDTLNIVSLFLPNTYQFYWNTSTETVFKRMKHEYDAFWSKNGRKEKASKLGLTIQEVSVLASIVESETQKNDEKPRVAGVYLNRLAKNMPLQADPTLVFALGDFTIKRVLNEDKQIDSPYNTYKYLGLPPGPIRCPEISSIDAVLNFEEHKYLFFCAREDFSGYHNFAKTLREHNVNATKYQRALSKNGILR